MDRFGIGDGNQFHESLVDAWFMSGYANGDSPASIRGVKGNELQLRNFAYALNSGFGKYTENFLNWKGGTNKSSLYVEIKLNTVTTNKALLYKYPQPNERISLIVKITGLKEGQQLYFGKWEDSNKIDIPCDGTYKMNYIYQSQSDTFGFRSAGNYTDVDVTILSLPIAYEGGLVFDGTDDYGICTGLPILDDYTVICRREIINKDYYSIASKSTVFGKGAFVFELIQGKTNHCYSFAADNQINLYNSEISWQTKNSYNGSTITVGNGEDTDTLTLGIIRVGDESRRFLQGAIYYFALYNKSLTPEEIETEKAKLENMWDSKLNKS